MASYDAGTEQAGFLGNLVPLGDLFSMDSPEGVSECVVFLCLCAIKEAQWTLLSLLYTLAPSPPGRCWGREAL